MTEIPPSFLALYLDGRQRLRLPAREVAARHEWCEDLAQQASETARLMAWQLGGGETEVLARVRAGLLASAGPEGSDSALSEPEAWWVEVRMAELLDWPHPDRPKGSD